MRTGIAIMYLLNIVENGKCVGVENVYYIKQATLYIMEPRALGRINTEFKSYKGMKNIVALDEQDG